VTTPADSTARLRGPRGRLATRAGWGLADQALSSLTNFAVGIYVARSLGPRGLGAFSLAFATYLLALNSSRGLATDPLVVRYSGVDTAAWRRAVARSTGVATTVGAVAGAASVAAGMLLRGPTGAAFTALGVVLPGLMLQDSWRYSFFSAGRGGQAFANDLVWAIVLFPLMAVVAAGRHPEVQWFVLGWGVAATLAALAGAVQARLVPRPSAAAGWLRQHRELAPRYLAENLSFSAATQLRLYGLSAVAGLAAVGALRAAELLLGPLNVVIMGIGLIGVPEGASVLRRSPRRLWPFCLVLGALQAAAALVWGLTMLLLPDGVGVRLLGPSWHPASELLVPVTINVALTGFWIGAWTGLRALGVARRSLRAQAYGSTAFLAGALLGAWLAGAAGAAWGGAAGTAVATGVWWWQLRQGLRAFQSSSTPAAGSEVTPTRGAGG
jgi:O-antigen/teichoic acid export membrane protein